jgi:hypothetical protein
MAATMDDLTRNLREGVHACTDPGCQIPHGCGVVTVDSKGMVTRHGAIPVTSSTQTISTPVLPVYEVGSTEPIAYQTPGFKLADSLAQWCRDEDDAIRKTLEESAKEQRGLDERTALILYGDPKKPLPKPNRGWQPKKPRNRR